MKKMLLSITILAGSILAQSPAIAADAAAGQTLHQKNCTSCHDDSVYKREDRRVTSAAGLRKQIKRCELSQGLKWFDEDVENVFAYLNSNYYKFK